MKLNVKLFVAYAFADLLSPETPPSVGRFLSLWAQEERESDEMEALLAEMAEDAENLAEVFGMIAERCRELEDVGELEARALTAPGEMGKEARRGLRLRALLREDPLELLAREGRQK